MLTIPKVCIGCFSQDRQSPLKHSRLEVRDDGRYETTCSEGHTTVTLLQQLTFEILFEIGANAIADGYYREAISSFQSSLERFYEFSIRVILSEKKNLSADIVDQSLKNVSKMSERQFGAFVFLWLGRFGEMPTVLPNTSTKLRNAVIHNGKIPSREEAIQFGDVALNLIRPKIEKLKSELDEFVCLEIRRSIIKKYNSKETHTAIETDDPTTLNISTLVSLGEDNKQNKINLEEYLSSMKSRES